MTRTAPRPGLCRRWPSLLPALPALLALLAPVALPAVEVPPPLATAIEASRASLPGSGLDDAQQHAAAELLDAAAGLDRDADALLEQAAQVDATASAAPPVPVVLSAAERERSLAEWSARLPARAGIDTLERLLARERAAVADLQARIDDVAAELADLLARPGLAADLVVLRRRIDETAPPATAAEPAEPAALAEARRLRRAAEHRRLRAELALRQAGQETAAVRQRDLEASAQSLRQELAMRLPRLDLLSQRIVELGRGELEELVRAHAARAVALETAGGAAAAAAAENAALAGELVETNERLARERAALAGLQQARDRVAAAQRDSQARLELGGASEVVGRWLWRERRALEPPRSLLRRQEALHDALGELRLRLLVLAEQRRELADLDAAAAALAQAHPETGEDDAAGSDEEARLRELLAARLELGERLEPLLRRRIEVLGDSEAALLAQLERSRALEQLLDRHLLWIRSHGPVDAAWLERLGPGLADLVRPSRFATSARLVAADLAARPLRWLAAVLAVVAVFLARRHARRRLPELARAVSVAHADRFAHTLAALAWTLAAASAWTVVAGLSGWLLQDIGSAGRYSDSVGRALVALALPVLTLSMLRWLVREDGLAEAHLRWSRPRLASLRRWLPLAQLVLLPAWFVVALAFLRNQELAIDVQARLALVAMALAGAGLLWRLLAPGAAWTPRGAPALPSNLRRLARIALPLLMLASAVLALAGYLYTAALLVRAQFASVGVVVAAALLHGLLARWFLLGERRLALRRLESRRDAGSEGGGDSESGEPLADAEQDLTLETVNAQSRRLLRALKLTLLVAGLAWTWSDLLPAIARLDQIALWHFTETGADGARVRQAVTLMALLLGVAVLALTLVAARNLPGLVEIGLQARPRIDAASRYAVTSVTRYAVVIAGVIVGLGLLGLRWSQLQWMAAALTVGLGFGLQEIFANFVSGLILLFERPFRVGDVITVGELSGTVTRIRTRATTIVDFDNKEIVIPNKAFITDRLVNWTLSDSTTRVTLKVGVAYGSPVEQVHALLLQAAREHPRVLAEPAPRSWFMAFGPSSLDFELRVFVATLGDRLVVMNELNGRIADLFQAEGIEIAFPQLDLHVRDVASGPVASGPGPATGTGAPPAPASS